jgi:hypothetical protein
MGFALVGLVCLCGAAALVVLVAAALLRLSVSITNRMVGPGKVRSGGIAEWDWDDWDDEYASPRARRKTGAVPEPGLGKCTAIVFGTALVFVLGFILMAFAGEELIGLRMWRDESKLAVAIFAFPVADLALLVLLIALLPTTFWRAAMVVFVHNLVVLGLTLGFGAGVFVLATAIG